MQNLKEEDVKTIYFNSDDEKVDLEGKKAAIVNRLKKSGVVNEDYKLTEKGQKLRNLCLSRFKQMEAGISVEKRPKSSIIVLRKLAPTWLSVPIDKQIVLIDPSKAFMIASNVQDVKQKRVGVQQKKKFYNSITDLIKDFNESGKEAYPMLFQRTADWEDFVWFQSGEQWVCVQSRFYEILVNMYKTPKFYITDNENAVFVSVGKTGISGVTAIIMAMEGIECENTKTGNVNEEEV